MDFRATSAARGFNWGFLLTWKDSSLQRQNQNLVCYHYTTGQSRGATYRLYSSPCRVCLLRSGARYGGSLRCCLGDNLFAGDRTYTVWRPDSDPTSLGYWCQPTGRRNEILYGVIRGHSLTPQRSSGQSRGNTAVGKETTLAENLTLRCLA